jgi:hypothetical protein
LLAKNNSRGSTDGNSKSNSNHSNSGFSNMYTTAVTKNSDKEQDEITPINKKEYNSNSSHTPDL